ncbi:MAG: hypothetical protein P8X90_33030, partial [Desulfobacterales bacterium]
ALVAAAWLFLASQQQVEITVGAPVRFDNIPADVQAGQRSAGRVELKLSGRQNELKALASRELTMHVNMKGFGPGKHLIRLSGKNVDLPAGVKVVQIVPRDIDVELSRIEDK